MVCENFREIFVLEKMITTFPKALISCRTSEGRPAWSLFAIGGIGFLKLIFGPSSCSILACTEPNIQVDLVGFISLSKNVCVGFFP